MARWRRRLIPTSNASPKSSPVDSSTQASIASALKNAHSSSTASNFSRIRKEFVRFCRSKHYAKRDIFPAHEDILCAYALSFAANIAGSTVRVKMSALKKWHAYNKRPWLGGAKLQSILDYVEKATPASSRLPPRAPVTTSMLQHLFHDLDLTQPLDAAVFAIALMSFFSQLRLGEITSSHRSLTHPKASNIPCFEHVTPPTDRSPPTLFLPQTKTSGHKGDSVILPRQELPFDAWSAFRNHCRVNEGKASIPIASFLDAKRKRVILTTKMFLQRCNAVWASHGFHRFTGHSFRIGGTTFFLLSRVDPQVVKAMGRWRSDAFLRYWRSLDALASIHTEYLRFP